MSVFSVGTAIALGLWVGGWAFWVMAVTPALFRGMERQEAGRVVGILFPAVDRWIQTWAAATVVLALAAFPGRHFEVRSLFLEIPIGIMACLTWYLTVVIHPKARELKRRLHDPELQGTTRSEEIRFAFNRMHRRSVRIGGLLLLAGIFALGLAPRLLP